MKRSQPNGIIEECTDKNTIEDACLEENKRRFTQSHNTTFASPEVLQHLDTLGTNDIAQRILEGQPHPLDLSPDQMKFISCLATPESIKSSKKLPNWITQKQWKSCWGTQKEDTSSGPSGLHFGHFKANARDEDLCFIDSTLASIPYATGYSPKRWSRGTNVMLYKKVMNNHVEKLRTILLYEADFNAMNKILGREMLSNGEENGTIANEQYGSRKNKTAINQCLNKKLTFDLWRQNKCTGAILSNDAKSCYDRILHNIASICMQRQGVHENNIICMFSTIQNLTHTVRTAFGDSETSFHQDIWAAPLHGVGQGNGAGPAIWAVISSPILDLLRKEGIGAAFKMNLTGKVVKILGYSFVDDTDLVVGGNCFNNDDIASELQRALDMWHIGIEAKGGALVPEKSFWSEVAFQWDDKGQWSYMEESEEPSQILMKDHKNEVSILRKTQPNEAIETLGVYLTPNGSDDIQCEAMRTKSTDWANKVKKGGSISRNDAWTCLRTTIMKTLEYPLPVTCLTKSQCTKILTPVLETALPGVGISRRFLHRYIHGPSKCFGLDVPCLYTYQGSAHLDMLVSHWDEISATGKLLKASMQILQVEVGLPGNPLNKSFEVWQETVTPCWLSSTWEFMSQYKINIDLTLEEIPTRRTNDRFIMESFIAKGAKKSQLKLLNRCRLYLKVITLADICDASGTIITPQAWNGTQMEESRSTIVWPNQGKPDGKSWTLWRSFPRKTLNLTNRVIPADNHLGSWLETPESSSWKWFFNPSSNQLFQKFGSIITMFKPRSKSETNKIYIRHSLYNSMPNTSLRCTVEKITLDKVRLTSYGDFRPVIKVMKPELYLPIEMEVSPEVELDIITGLYQGSIIAVSDGSLKSSFGTGAFIVYNISTGKYIRGCIIRHDGPSDQ